MALLTGLVTVAEETQAQKAETKDEARIPPSGASDSIVFTVLVLVSLEVHYIQIHCHGRRFLGNHTVISSILCFIFIIVAGTEATV